MLSSWFRYGLLTTLLLTAGCVFPGFSPRTASPEMEASSGLDGASVSPALSPRARELFERARAVWDENDVCRQPAIAAAWLDAALEVQPDYAEALLWRGRALGESGYLEDAFDDLTRSIRLQPTALAYAERGLIGLRLGNDQGAERDLNRALNLHEGEPRIYVYRAALRFTRNQANEACADLAAACAHGLCLPREKAAREGLCH